MLLREEAAMQMQNMAPKCIIKKDQRQVNQRDGSQLRGRFVTRRGETTGGSWGQSLGTPARD